MKIAYLGIDILQGALRAALDAGCEVLKIFSCETDNVTEFNTAVLDTARRAGIRATTRRIERADLDDLAAQGCELLLCAGYYHRAPLTDAFPMVNIHPAPLPDCRGAWPMPLILLGAHDCGGVVLHRMAREFDTGDILLERSFALGASDTLEDYMARANAIAAELTRTLINDLPGCLRAARPQGAGRYLENPTERDWTVSDAMGADEADRVLRAFYGYECVYLRGGEKYELIRARAARGPADGPFPLRDGRIIAQRARRIA